MMVYRMAQSPGPKAIDHQGPSQGEGEGYGVKSKKSSEDERERLLEAGWDMQVRGGLIVWRRPGGLGNWYSQRVAMELAEFLEEEKDWEGRS